LSGSTDFTTSLLCHAEEYQSSLDIRKGDVLRLVLIQTPSSYTHNRLLIIAHHLVIDGVSWRILLEDLEALLTGIRNHAVVSLGAKSSSYREWYNALLNYNAQQNQQAYWSAITSQCVPLPIDKPYSGDLFASDYGSCLVKLDTKTTSQLLHDVPAAYHTEINDVLLSALSSAISQTWGIDRVVIGMEGHGRENISSSVDVSRTIGWFTSMYPVLLKNKEDTGSLLKG
ncbi:condensation domain-containing protein, partial [Chitinophaga oryziterrae]|uniref:condensation domain-containing protein n=1 Tax=Chitinophaga oryziterrae TaxID=1031224 RepID=UPI00196A21E2